MAKPNDAKTDWDGLKVQFGQCDLTLKDFAASQGISLSTLRRHAGADHWLDYREDVRRQAAAIAAEQAPEERAKRLLQQQAELEDKLHTTLLAQLDAIGGADNPIARKTEAISFGIMMDKRNQELGRQTAGSAEDGVVEEVYARRKVLMSRYKDPEEGDGK